MAVKPHGVANRPGEPYPATFRIQWTGWESNPPHRSCKDQSPPWHMPAHEQRSVRESNPAFRLTKAVCSRSTYRPQVSNRSDPGRNRPITFLVVTQAPLPLDHGI